MLRPHLIPSTVLQNTNDITHINIIVILIQTPWMCIDLTLRPVILVHMEMNGWTHLMLKLSLHQHGAIAFCYQTVPRRQNPQILHPVAFIFGIENVLNEVTRKLPVITSRTERKSEHRWSDRDELPLCCLCGVYHPTGLELGFGIPHW